MNIETLLGRPLLQFDGAARKEAIAGKRILVTGAGGSIGSEICRMIAECDPESLILLFDQSEFNLFTIANDLAAHANRKSIIGSVRDAHRVGQVCEAEKPDIIIHAAALKHVGLCETNVREAVLTNIVGTMNVVGWAKTVVLVSTDKAVQPVGIMGATKRAAEALASNDIVVRLGNVFASSGSLGQIFDAQIAKGGPVTVTDPAMTRYFMTATEAAGVVLDALARNDRGLITVPKIEKPLNIMALAKLMIGGRPIDIEIIGARPGEKLTESFLSQREMVVSETESIRIALPSEEIEEIAGRANRIAEMVDDPDVEQILRDCLLTLVRTE